MAILQTKRVPKVLKRTSHKLPRLEGDKSTILASLEDLQNEDREELEAIGKALMELGNEESETDHLQTLPLDRGCVSAPSPYIENTSNFSLLGVKHKIFSRIISIIHQNNTENDRH